MKIIHADTDDLDNPLRGGQPVRTYEINSRIAREHEVTVWTAVFPASARRKCRNGVAYRRLGFNIKPFGLSPHLTYLSCLGPALLATPHDIVVEEFMPPFGFCLLPWWTRKPVVTIVQWFFFEYWENRYLLPFKTGMRAIARSNRYRFFIVQTNSMVRRIRKVAPEALIEKIPCGINPNAYIAPVAYGDFALFLGRLDIRQKGLDVLLDAWQGACRRQNIPLIIAGDGPDRQWLQERTAAMGLTSLVTFAGRVEGRRKEELLRTCRFMVMPSRMETFGISAIEAMAARKPVIAFDIESLNELMEPGCGILVRDQQPEPFARAVCDLWGNPDACRQMGHTAHRAARAYHWDDLARRQLAFYETVREMAAQ